LYVVAFMIHRLHKKRLINNIFYGTKYCGLNEGKPQLLNIESQLTSVIFLPHIRYRQIHFLI
jgi:hypothetical protein